ncbi:MAG: ATP-binding cassette domain-containing protein [Deltaproteobacteria bacterium]|nr:ATP-binding cassette domain-containing protein [Deltaproteobacteria bacterium]
MKASPEINQRKTTRQKSASADTLPPGHTAIKVKNIGLRFGEKIVIKDFSLTLFPGEKVVLTGDSGSGKSSLIRCIMGFCAPDCGEIFINGTRLTPESVWNLRQTIAYVPQEPDTGPGTLEQWLARPFSFRINRNIRSNIEKIPGLARRLGLLPDILKTDSCRLSGGEKQRAALLSALLLERKILIADEPTSALDCGSAKKITQFITDLPGVSCLLVSHDSKLAKKADRVVNIP